MNIFVGENYDAIEHIVFELHNCCGNPTLFKLNVRKFGEDPKSEHSDRKSAGIKSIWYPEHWLHPKSQSCIIENLIKEFTNVQFFIVTNSPFIIQQAKPGQLINIECPSKFEQVDFRYWSISEISNEVLDLEYAYGEIQPHISGISVIDGVKGKAAKGEKYPPF